MDRRSWPWKKKSSEKTVSGATDTKSTSLPNSGDSQADQDDSQIVKYVQISIESYEQLTELEGQVKDSNAKISELNTKISGLNAKISDLSDKLSSAQSEMTTKDNLVKQHVKVAEEAVSGWEKAEAEALALKHQLESVMLLKHTAENRVSHLDDALKECMKQVRNVKEECEQQVRNVKEESERKLRDVVFAKSKQWENAKAQLEARIIDFEQELLRSSAENAALSRSLQERSNMLMKISGEKSQVDSEIEVMKSDLQTYDREVDSLKYELHVMSKELEIRNEEKNMSMRSAEVANKQHLEDVKKITKLEAECQRLRALVRKKLPGPAALAQMKLEVENLGRDYGDTRPRRSPAKSSSPHNISSPSDFALENMQQCRKENEFLTARLLTMEEEMKMLKEALSQRNSELQASRNMCAKTASKLHNIEAHVLVMNQQKSPMKSIADVHFENESNPASLTSMSEDGIDEEGSSESLATALMSEVSQIKKEKKVDKGKKTDDSNQLELMDDFLEMEKLACLPTEATESIVISDGAVDNKKTENLDSTLSPDVQNDVGANERQPAFLLPPTSNPSNVNHPSDNLVSDRNDSPSSTLQLKIACLFESRSQGTDMGKLLEDIRKIVQDAQLELPQHSVDCVVDETNSISDTCMEKECHEDMGGVGANSSKPNTDHVMDHELKDAISQILDFVSSFGKGASESQGKFSNDSGLTEKIEEFCATVKKVLCNEVSLDAFIVALSHILSETAYLSSTMLSDKGNEGESYISDCIDKATLLENKVAQHEHAKERFSEVCSLASPSSSDPEVEGLLAVGFDLKAKSQICTLEEFEQLKLEKEIMETELTRCQETLELTKLQFVETEAHLVELKLQLAASEKSNSLAETQLKCMAESYKSLESRKEELENEVSLLQAKAEMLVSELQEEKHSHQDDLAKYKELQEQIERNNKCSNCSDADVGTKTKQKEREIAAAAEKLAQCQETIFLLSRQLNALHRPAEPTSSSPSNMQQKSDETRENEPSARQLTRNA
ncbi:filament-like plant protein 4 [Iris pallida]|uniref:Filament-like plant protein 4 n=1 Tax=Iris pallida TaxID=29817 RepID=A0AAX6GMR4_IRIPA|nr:filament-like plant protein 4 [Iris pallida]